MKTLICALLVAFLASCSASPPPLTPAPAPQPCTVPAPKPPTDGGVGGTGYLLERCK